MKRFALVLALALILLAPAVLAEETESPAFGREFSSEYAAYGDYVTLRYIVRNTLDEDLSAVTVSDPLVGVVGYAEALPPGEKCLFTARIRITADCLSTPTLSYTLGGETLTVSAPQGNITLENAALSATLSEETGEEGRMLVLTVTNQGNAPIYGIKAIDQVLGDMGAAVSGLNTGESVRFERALTSDGSHLCRISAQSAGGQTLEIESNALNTDNAQSSTLPDGGSVTLSAALCDGHVLVSIENGTNTLYENLTLTERTGGETRSLRFLPAQSRTQLLWAAGEAGDTLTFDLALPDGQTVSAEPLTLETSPVTEEDPLDAIPDGVSFRMTDNPQTYRNMMFGAGLILLALGAGAWLAATVKRRRKRRLRLKKRQERKRQRQKPSKKIDRTNTRRDEEKEA